MTVVIGNDAGVAFANLVEKVFSDSGYDTNRNIRKPLKDQASRDVDFVATSDNNSYYVEAKYSMQKHIVDLSRYENTIRILVDLASPDQAIPVLVIMAIIDSKCKAKYEKVYKGLIIIDVSNLLFGIQGTKLHNELMAFLPYSVDDIVPREGKLNLSFLEHSMLGAGYAEKLDNCPAGKEGASQFEKICTEMLKYAFDRELALWKEQNTSNNELYRFDLLCRIKDDNEKT